MSTRARGRRRGQPARSGGIESGAQPPALASGLALRLLITTLAASGMPVTGLMLTRRQAVLLLPDGRVVRCWGGWLLWQTGKVSGQGRPLHTLHCLHDVAGAVRRLAQTGLSPSAGQA
jgi:hypothetical protein